MRAWPTPGTTEPQPVPPAPRCVTPSIPQSPVLTQHRRFPHPSAHENQPRPATQCLFPQFTAHRAVPGFGRWGGKVQITGSASSLSDLAQRAGQGGGDSLRDGWEKGFRSCVGGIKAVVPGRSTGLPFRRSPFLRLLPRIFSSVRPVSAPRPGDAAVSGCKPGRPASIPTRLSPVRANETAGSPAPP